MVDTSREGWLNMIYGLNATKYPWNIKQIKMAFLLFSCGLILFSAWYLSCISNYISIGFKFFIWVVNLIGMSCFSSAKNIGYEKMLLVRLCSIIMIKTPLQLYIIIYVFFDKLIKSPQCD